MDSNKNNETKESHGHSIYLYTALIFIVAILMIVLAFFGQSNLDKNQLAQPTGNSITEKSAALSDENLVLRDKNADLTERLETAETNLKKETELKETKEKVISAVLKGEHDDYIAASQILDTINKDLLSSEDLEIYNILKEKAAPYEAVADTSNKTPETIKE